MLSFQDVNICCLGELVVLQVRVVYMSNAIRLDFEKKTAVDFERLDDYLDTSNGNMFYMSWRLAIDHFLICTPP